MTERPAGPALPTTIAWGLFCACSWTWCIGMFLPRIMLDRFGWPGFVVFAVPNVIGCAGFGYALARPGARERLVAEHGPMLGAFSVVAIAFQLFFATWLLAMLAPDLPPWAPTAGALAIFAVGNALSLLRDRAWLVLAVATYAITVAAMATTGPTAPAARWAPHDLGALAYVLPIVTIGFLLCPYLDLTFHRALAQAPSRHAFAVFGVTFAPVIVFTCFLWYPADGELTRLALAHVVAQLTFTVGAHLRELREAPAPRGAGRRRLVLLAPLVGLLALPATRLLLAESAADAGEPTYLRFLVFYGLVFPAYVLVFVGPWRPARLAPRAIAGFVVAMLAIAPALEAGFVHEQWPWLAAAPLAMVVWIAARRVREA